MVSDIRSAGVILLMSLSCLADTSHVVRDAHGRIKRSAVVKRAFERSHPCPSTTGEGGARPVG